LPVTGGLFLGSDATNALNQTGGRFWDSQDQRNTLHGRLRYQLTGRAWIALSEEYGSGLPTEVSNTPQEMQDAIAQYGQAIVDRVDFAHGRVKPSMSIGVSGGMELWKHNQITTRLQAEVQNLNNRLNLINFAGLFSGNAVAPSRSYGLRLQAAF
jgi:outer membrane receptor for Fe3+-dicitrate